MLLPWLNYYDLLIFDRIDSTNDEAIRLAKAGVKSNLVIVAREQDKGKGQSNKAWQSISGNLHASILLQSQLTLNRLKELSCLVAVSLYDAIAEQIEILDAPEASIKLKWPNDVLIDGKKIAGILLESIKIAGKTYVIIGIGVNTHFMPEIKGMKVTSLLNEGVILRHSDDFLSVFMDKFHFYYNKWQAEESFDKIRKKWLRRAYKLDQLVTLNDGTQIISGIFKGIDQEGLVCLQLPNGELRSFTAGEIVYN